MMLVVNETKLTRYWLWKLHRDWLRPDGRLVIPGRKSFRLSPATLEAIAATFPPERDVLFPWVNTRRGFYNALERLFKRAELERSRWFGVTKTRGKRSEWFIANRIGGTRQ